MAIKPEVQRAQIIAAQQEKYYRAHGVYFGNQPKDNASWSLALNQHPVSKNEYGFLNYDLPYVIGDFHRISVGIIRRALLNPEESALNKFRQQLTANVPDETLAIYYEAIKQNLSQPFSSRPDTLRPRGSSNFPIIEYNVDGTADKGFTEAVNISTSRALDEQTIGGGLAKFFVEGVRQLFPEGNPITVATVVPEDYRLAYNPQLNYFADRANTIGENYNLRWITAKTSEVDIRRNGLFVDNEKIDVVDKEFHLPGYSEDLSLNKEAEIVHSTLDGKATLLGTPLPLGDKLLLSIPFNPDLRQYVLEDLGEQAEERLAAIQTAHAETHVLTPEQDLTFSHKKYFIEDLSHPDNMPGFILKQAGNTAVTSESKGVTFSHGRGSKDWNEDVKKALELTSRGEAYWVVQKIIESEPFDIGTIKSSRANSERLIIPAPVRFAPYYVHLNGRLNLGSVLVTAGTDREVSKLGSLNIHGQRDNTYQGAVIR